MLEVRTQKQTNNQKNMPWQHKKKNNTLKPLAAQKKIPRTQLNYFLLGMGYRLFFNIVYLGEKVSR